MKRSSTEPHVLLLKQVKATTTQQVNNLFIANGDFERRVKSLQNLLRSPLFTSDFLPATRTSPDENLSNNNRCTTVQLLVNKPEEESAPAAKKLRITGKPADEVEPEVNDASASTSQSSTDEEASETDSTPREPVPIHPQIDEMIKSIKPELIDVHRQARLIKTWVGLSQPKYEEGNNAGIEVLDMVGALADGMLTTADGHMENLMEWYANRGERVKNALSQGKNVPEGWAAVDLADEIQFYWLKLIVQEVHDTYIVLFDSVIKNLDRIQKPRSEHRTSVS